MSKFLQATNLTRSDSTATSVFQNCPVIHCVNYLSSNVLSLYCIFDVQNLVLCLNRELIKIIDNKIMLKLQCKTTFNPVFVGKKIIKIEQESTLE